MLFPGKKFRNWSNYLFWGKCLDFHRNSCKHSETFNSWTIDLQHIGLLIIAGFSPPQKSCKARWRRSQTDGSVNVEPRVRTESWTQSRNWEFNPCVAKVAWSMVMAFWVKKIKMETFFSRFWSSSSTLLSLSPMFLKLFSTLFYQRFSSNIIKF